MADKLTNNENNSYEKIKNEIKKGEYFKVTIKQGKEESHAYFKIVQGKKNPEELYLKSYSSVKYKSNGYNEQKINANNLNGINVKKLESMKSIKARLYQFYKNKNKHDKEKWIDDDVVIDFKNVTASIKKEQIQNNKNNKQKINTSEQSLTLVIPQDLQNAYKNKYNKELTSSNFKENLFNVTKQINEIPEKERNLNEYELAAITPLLIKYKSSEGTEEQLRKQFDDFINDKNNKERIELLGNMYKKSLNDNFIGFKKKHEPNIEYERDKMLEAIKQCSFPLMKKTDNIDYIYNPETNSIYRGSNQVGLQTNNNLNNINAQAYVSLDSQIRQNGILNKKLKACSQIIAKGRNTEGNYIFEVVVPCKVTSKEKRAIKAAAKEEKRRNIKDAKYKYKYGELPVYHTKLQLIPNEQPAIISKDVVKLDKPIIDENTNIEKRLEVDAARYFTAMITKTPYVPATNWTEPKWHQSLYNFASENPEKVIKIENESYQKLAEQVRNLNNSHSNVNEIVQEKVEANHISKTSGRTR